MVHGTYLVASLPLELPDLKKKFHYYLGRCLGTSGEFPKAPFFSNRALYLKLNV